MVQTLHLVLYSVLINGGSKQVFLSYLFIYFCSDLCVFWNMTSFVTFINISLSLVVR